MEGRYSKARFWMAIFTAQSMCWQSMAWAAQIVTDGRTQTRVDNAGTVTDIRTGTIRGANAYNSFKHFGVNAGQTVNLHLPGKTSNLLNLVHDSRTDIHGVLNSFKNGVIGGNVFIANPHGIVVGKSGSVNVGSLGLSTPTQQFMQSFFDGNGNPVDAASAALMAREIPINADASIRIDGRVNAIGDVSLQAGSIAVTGQVNALPANTVGMPDTASLVNAEGVEQGTALVERAGEIWIMAEGDANISGEIHADGADGIDAGSVEVLAGNDIQITQDARVTAAGKGENSHGGSVIVLAENDTTLKDNAQLDASAGNSGDGGFVELSAKQTVHIEGGKLSAGAESGKAGQILIDPTEVLWTGSGDDQFSDGAAITVEADNRIVLDNVMLSTRKIDEADTRDNHETKNSAGDSGDITLESKSIELKNGTKLLADVESGSAFSGGDVNLITTNKDYAELVYANAVSKIIIDSATIKANNITASAKAEGLYAWGGDTENLLLGATDVIGTIDVLALRTILTQLTGINIGIAMARGDSSVTVKSGSVLQADNKVSLKSETNASAGTYTVAKPAANAGAFALGIIYGETKAHSTVDVQSGATIRSADLEVDARNIADLNLNVFSVSTTDSANAAIAIGKTDVKSKAQIASGAIINVTNNVDVAALNNDRLKVASTAMAVGAGKAGISTSFLFTDNKAEAIVDANTTGINNLNIQALDNNIKNRMTASASTGSSFSAKYIAAPAIKKMNAAANKISSKFMETKDAPPGAASKPKLAGALTYADSNQTANARIGDNSTVTASGDVIVSAKVEDERLQNHAQSEVASQADNPTPENPAATTGVSVAVAYGDYTHTADAHIGNSANITAQHVGVRSDVLMPWEQTWWKWEGLDSIISKLNGNLGVANGFLTGYANAQSAADNFALAGAVTYLDFNNNSTAYLGKSASITILPGGADTWSSNRIDGIGDFLPVTDINVLDELGCTLTLGCTKLKFVDEQVNWAGAVNVIANTEVDGVYSSGNLGITLKGVGAGDGGKSVGASFNQIDYTNTTKAFIAEGATVQQQAGTTAVDVNVIATTQDNMIVVSPTAGRGGGLGFNGQLSLAYIDSTTEASIDDEAQVKANELIVKAEDEAVTWALSGAFNMSDSAAVGVAIAIADVKSRTNAFIGDNDINLATSSNLTGSILSLTNGSIDFNDIAVHARTDGRIETISVAAVLAQSDDPNAAPGKFSQAKTKTIGKLNDSRFKTLNKIGGALAGSGGAKKSEPKFGVGISGAASVNLVDLDTNAYIKHKNVNGTGSNAKLTVRAVNDTDITAAAGSAALVRANAPSVKRSAAFAGAVTYNDLDNDTSAYIDTSDISDARDVDVVALEGGEQLSVAIGASVNSSADQSKAGSAAGSVSISKTSNSANAYVKDSTVQGNGNGNLNVIAYDRTYLGTGAGSLFAGGKAGFGVAVTYSDIANTSQAYVSNAKITNEVTGNAVYNNIQIQGLTAAKIGAGGGMAGFTNADAKGTLAGAFVISDISNTTNAEIKNDSIVTARNKVDLLARDINEVSSLDTIIDEKDGGNPNSKSLDYDGAQVGQTEATGSSVFSVAGVLQYGANNVGVSVNVNDINNKFNAKITDSAVTTKNNAGITGNINVLAHSTAKITGISAGVGIAKDEFAGGGSITINEIDNEVRAEISPTSGQKISTNHLKCICRK